VGDEQPTEAEIKAAIVTEIAKLELSGQGTVTPAPETE
jgi:hypothetical protein